LGLLDALKGLFGGGKPKKAMPAGAKPAPKKAKIKRYDLKKRFELQGRTGQGSMSRVWRAYDRTLGRTVCLKILDKEKTKKFEDRFLGRNKPPEGEICMSLKHPNIVKTFEWAMSTKGEPFLVMELIDGVGLNFLVETRSSKLIGNEPEILSQLADAVEYLHRERWLHRDLCPRNVMVTNDGVVKLIDFGLTIPYRPEFCSPGNRTGTPDYLAPEIIRRQTTDHRVDLFALGVTAFEVYTGDLPWQRSTVSTDALQKHINQPPRDPLEVKHDLDEDVRRFLLKAVERDVRARFQTAAEFREALQPLVRAK
jgi:serine/threonine protein kinase